MQTSIRSSLVLAITLSAAASAQDRAVFLIDRSGSMQTTIPSTAPCNVTTRAAKVDCQAQFDIDTYFTMFPNGTVLVREFTTATTNGIVEDLGAWRSDPASAKADVLAPPPSGRATRITGSTPLAAAICDTVTLVAGLGATSVVLWIYSDGGENVSTGPCSGPTATNATNGRCLLDWAQTTRDPYTEGQSGSASWQQNTCAMIASLGLVLNVYAFNDFATDSTPAETRVFALLESAVRTTGGRYVEIDDAAPIPGASASIGGPGGCRGPDGRMAYLHAAGLPQIGQLFTVELHASSEAARFITFGLERSSQPLDLTFIGAPGCTLFVDQFVAATAVLPIVVPFDPSLAGVGLHFQGVTLDWFAARVTTTSTLDVRIQP